MAALRPGRVPTARLCSPEACTPPERESPHCTQLFSWMPLWTTAKGNITAWPVARGLLGAAAQSSEQPRQTRSQRRCDFRLCFKLTAAFHRGLRGPCFQTGGEDAALLFLTRLVTYSTSLSRHPPLGLGARLAAGPNAPPCHAQGWVLRAQPEGSRATANSWGRGSWRKLLAPHSCHSAFCPIMHCSTLN